MSSYQIRRVALLNHLWRSKLGELQELQGGCTPATWESKTLEAQQLLEQMSAIEKKAVRETGRPLERVEVQWPHPLSSPPRYYYDEDGNKHTA